MLARDRLKTVAKPVGSELSVLCRMSATAVVRCKFDDQPRWHDVEKVCMAEVARRAEAPGGNPVNYLKVPTYCYVGSGGLSMSEGPSKVVNKTADTEG